MGGGGLQIVTQGREGVKIAIYSVTSFTDGPLKNINFLILFRLFLSRFYMTHNNHKVPNKNQKD
jgi:hypothetical protein